MTEMEIVGPWVGGLRGERVRLVAATYACRSWRDTSSQPAAQIPPWPNVCTVRATVDDETAATILADEALECVEPDGEVLSVEEREALGAYLLTAGAREADVEAALGEPEATASAVIGCLRTWCRALKLTAEPIEQPGNDVIETESRRP